MHSAPNFVLGKPTDWHIQAPRFRGLRPGLSWVGPLAIFASAALSWPAFAGATGDEGTVAFGLWVGAVSILLMAWSFLLSIRLRFLEPIFGGLDKAYRAHRWSGALAVVFMFLHTSVEPEIEGGIRGASKSVADSAQDLAGAGEIMLYILIGLSLFRLVPYRYWRWSHKLLGLPFGFASWHFYTSEKPYANSSTWGWWFGAWMVLGLVCYLVRVVGRDVVLPGRRYRVVGADHIGTTTRLELEPVGRPIGQHLGQFAFVKLDVAGMAEPHPFTIASAPDKKNLVFFIRHLGDWSAKLATRDLLGASVRVEGPYGRFEPFGAPGQQCTWIAGGVGITPFLAALDGPVGDIRPSLFYAVREVDNNPIVDRLRQAESQGRVDLHLFTTATGRLSAEALDLWIPGGLEGHHVALCGPSGLVNAMAAAASSRGAKHIEVEDFDIRQGFGPNRSFEIEQQIEAVMRRLKQVANPLIDPKQS